VTVSLSASTGRWEELRRETRERRCFTLTERELKGVEIGSAKTDGEEEKNIELGLTTEDEWVAFSDLMEEGVVAGVAGCVAAGDVGFEDGVVDVVELVELVVDCDEVGRAVVEVVELDTVCGDVGRVDVELGVVGRVVLAVVVLAVVVLERVVVGVVALEVVVDWVVEMVVLGRVVGEVVLTFKVVVDGVVEVEVVGRIVVVVGVTVLLYKMIGPNSLWTTIINPFIPWSLLCWRRLLLKDSLSLRTDSAEMLHPPLEDAQSTKWGVNSRRDKQSLWTVLLEGNKATNLPVSSSNHRVGKAPQGSRRRVKLRSIVLLLRQRLVPIFLNVKSLE
jgi:hypothetical protein